MSADDESSYTYVEEEFEDSPMIKYCQCPDRGSYYEGDEVHCYNAPEESYTDNQILFSKWDQVHLFWNLEHYPISQGADLSVIRKRLKLCLHRMGVHGFVFINTYGGKLSHTQSELRNAYITHTPSPPPKEWTIAGQICAEILRIIASQWPSTSDFVVIAKQDPHSEMTRVLHSLQSGHKQTLVTIEPHHALFDSADSIHQCAAFVGGGKTKPLPERYTWSPTEPTSPPPPDLAIGVFWDACDCPFPPTWTADSIYDVVQQELTGGKGLDGCYMSMCAYVDEKKDSSTEFLGTRTWTSNINFHPAKHTSAARHERMLHDILLWAIGFPMSFKYLHVACRINEQMYTVLEHLEAQTRCGGIKLLIPSGDYPLPHGMWPQNLCEHVYYIGREIEIESQSEGTDLEGPKKEGKIRKEIESQSEGKDPKRRQIEK